MLKDYCIEAFSRPVKDLADNPDLSPNKLKEHFDSNSYELLDALNGLIGELSGETGLDGLKISGRDINEVLNEIKAALNEKADNIAVTEELSGKADKTAVEQSLSTKADKSETEAELSGKADKSETEEKLSGKADKSETEEKLSGKADKTAVEQLLSGKVDKQAGKDLSTNDYTDFEKTKIRLADYRDIDSFLEDGFYIVYEDAPEASGKYWTLYPLIQTSMFTGEETEYTQVKYTEYGIKRRVSYGTADNYGEWERKDAVKVADFLTSTDKTAALSANMGRVLSEKLDAALHYKGEIEETELPAENNVKGDLYRIVKTTVEPIYKYFSSGKLVYESWIGDMDEDGVDEIISDGTGFYEEVGYSLLTAEEGESYGGLSVPINIYDENKNFLFETSMFYAGEISLWAIGGTSSLTLDSNYYIERADGVIPDYTEPEQVGEKTVISKDTYALYNGSGFDYLYNIDGVKNAIKDKQDTDKWELIDIFELESSTRGIDLTQEPDGTPYDFKKVRVVISELYGSGTGYFYNNGSYTSEAYFKLSDNDVLAENYIEGDYIMLKTYSGLDRSTASNVYCASPLRGKSITKVDIGGTSLPSGTKIKIWGVRS